MARGAERAPGHTQIAEREWIGEAGVVRAESSAGRVEYGAARVGSWDAIGDRIHAKAG